MRRSSRLLTALVMALALAGCAGKDFTRPAAETLVLGKTTYPEINARFGSPFRESTLVKNEKTVRAVSYAYSTTAGDPYASGVTPARGIDFFFLDQVLVGHQFVSSFKTDHTEFDESKAPVIKKGVTTRADLATMLGPPVGLQTHPLVNGKDDTGLVWAYVQVRMSGLSPTIYQKQLIVSVDPTGVVTDVQLTVSGER